MLRYVHRATLRLPLAMVLFSVLVGRATAGELTVVSVEPALNAISAATNADIVFNFDRAVNTSTVTSDTLGVFARWSGPVSGTIAFSNGDQTVTFTPSRSYSAGERVMVGLSHDVEGADASPMRAGGYAFSFWTITQPATLNFEKIATLTTNVDGNEHSQPYGGTATDLDMDGWLDLSIVNEVSGDLRVFMNVGDGNATFEPFGQPTEPIGDFASPNEAADFNRDGFADIAIANQGTDTVTVLLGSGDGTFFSNQEIPVGDLPRGLAVLDVDGDGDTDIVTSNFNSSNMSTLLNDGNGVFGAATFWEAGGNRERAVVAADMDNDGITDLVIGTQPTNRIIVARGNGDGTFTNISEQATGGPVWMVVVGDVNGDGNEDVTSANSSANNADILLGDGNGNVAPPTTYATDPFPLATDLGDLDGDGDLDWVVSSFGGDWFLFVNDGNGNFTFQAEFDATSTASCSLLFDADNDGDLDLALVDETADELIIMRNCGVGAPECECVVASAPQSDPIGIKNRFLSVAGGNPGSLTAIRVTFTSLPEPYHVWNGARLWVSAPVAVSENGGSVAPIPGSPNFQAARLTCDGPVYRDWSALGLVHAFHEGIVPGGIYDIQEIDTNCGDLGNEGNYSAPLALASAAWGDTITDFSVVPPGPPNGILDIIDAFAIIGRFVSDPVAISKARAEMEPDCVDLFINITDVLRALSAFLGLPYPYNPTVPDPCDSPCINPLP